MFITHPFCEPQPQEKSLKVTHLEKIPIRFILDKKTQNFRLKFNKVKEQNSYSKIEFDFENNLILLQSLDDPTIYSISFPPEFTARKESLLSENFNWEATKTQIIISYKNPPTLIVIDENTELITKPKVITIDDSEDIFPRSRGIRVIHDIAEIENAISFRYMDKDSKKRYDHRLKNVMKTVEEEFAHSISLKKSQIKKLAEQLIDKDFDSYDKAQENGYSFDVSSNLLYINNDLPDSHKNFEDPNEFNEIKDVNTMEHALQDLDKAVKRHKKKNEKTLGDSLRIKRSERQWNEYLMENGADEKELNFEDEKEFEDYDIKKKNDVYIVNENKFKRLMNNANQKFKKGVSEEDEENKLRQMNGLKGLISLKRKRNHTLQINDEEEEDERFL